MQWTPEAEAAVKRIPFFVRKRVRARIEKEAGEAGKNLISLEDVNATKARYLESMESEIKGYLLDTCFGPSGCPNRAVISNELIAKLESLLRKEDLLGFLKKRVKGDIKFHHEFRVTVADCPNACSQPQIKDIGIIGACLPKLSIEPCSRCEACVETCREQAITLYEEQPVPDIDYRKCLGCGRCIPICPSGTLVEGKKGYRVRLGGKLGRHPRLAREIPGIFEENQVLNIVKACIDFYKKNSISGERFAEILTEDEFFRLSKLYALKGGAD